MAYIFDPDNRHRLGTPASAETTRKKFLGLVGGAFAVIALASATSVLATQQSEHLPPNAPPPKPEPVMSQDQKWRSRFPQPVLVSDLVGRKILDRDQGGLGKVTAVVKDRDQGIMILFARRHLLFFSGDTVAVPVSFTAVLGPFVMILDLSDEQLASLPVTSIDQKTQVEPTAHIQMALTKH